MKAVNNLLTTADEAIRNAPFFDAANNAIGEIYKNYTAQFCVSVVQAGLLPACAYFKENSESKDGTSSYITDALARMLGYGNTDGLIAQAQSLDNNKPAARLLKQKAIHAAIALKIMMKTYSIVKKEKENA